MKKPLNASVIFVFVPLFVIVHISELFLTIQLFGNIKKTSKMLRIRLGQEELDEKVEFLAVLQISDITP